VNIGDVPTAGRKPVLMAGSCDAAIRASTHARDMKSCPDPSSSPDNPECCCHPSCDQGKCSSFTFERNIVYAPSHAGNGTFVGETWWGGLANFTFAHNVYYAAGKPRGLAGMFNSTPAGPQWHAESLAEWQKHGKDAGSLDADPQFAAPPPAFSLDPASPAITQEGFVPIDLSRVGPRPERRSRVAAR